MPLSKPYKRLYRPSISKGPFDESPYRFLYDSRYISEGEKISLLTAARLIIHDLEELFVYIEPTDDHKIVYSHRVYELYLRVCTEIEANCKGILEANGYTKRGDFNMSDYKKIEQATCLSSYEVIYGKWSPKFVCKPFAPWAEGGSLQWYQDYNSVKHDRYCSFSNANLGNLMQAICALMCILSAQFGKYIDGLMSQKPYTILVDSETVNISSFDIIPHIWQDTEKYNFDWNILSSSANAFSLFNFA